MGTKKQLGKGFASAHGVALIGSPKGVTWLPGVLKKRRS
jgi:hypothetical protein